MASESSTRERGWLSFGAQNYLWNPLHNSSLCLGRVGRRWLKSATWAKGITMSSSLESRRPVWSHTYPCPPHLGPQAWTRSCMLAHAQTTPRNAASTRAQLVCHQQWLCHKDWSPSACSGGSPWLPAALQHPSSFQVFWGHISRRRKHVPVTAWRRSCLHEKVPTKLCSPRPSHWRPGFP